MRIALVYPSFRAVGGAENVVIWLAESLVKRGHNVFLFTHEFSEEVWGNMRDRPYTVCLLNFKKRRSTLRTNRDAGMALRRAISLSLYDFDVINPHNYPASLWVYYARLHKENFPSVLLYLHNLTRNFYEKLIDMHLRRLPGFVNIWGRYRPKKIFRSLRQFLFGYRRLDRAAVLSCERVLANSVYASDLAKKIYGIEILPCLLGVSVERYRNHIEEVSCLANRKNHVPNVLTVARVEVQKNIETILKAIRLLKKKEALPHGFKYVIAGDGPHLNYIKRKSRGIGYMMFLGTVPHENVWKLYAEANFIVHIPLDEPFGLVPLEAALLRKPCIVSDHGGPADIVKNGVTGYHVNALDPNDVAQKISHLLEYPDVAETMGNAAYNHVMENMTWSVFVQRFEQHLTWVAHHPKI
jgi:glycosyltransferase involved in cell wall biosynthesis